MTLYSDLALSRRLERTEGTACARFAEARRRVYPDKNSEWIESAGAIAVFDGADSPTTQSFGLGLFEELTPAKLDAVERFFLERGAPVNHEVSPLAGLATLDLLCSRNYRPVELSSVLYRLVDRPQPAPESSATAREIRPGEAPLWGEISAQAWANEYPDLLEFLREASAIAAVREHSPSFIAELDGQPGAAGSLCLHEGVALLGGSATLPAMRRRGLQSALVEARLLYAFDHKCDLAMMVAETGSNSQRNAERRGFKIAYTRTKWRLLQ